MRNRLKMLMINTNSRLSDLEIDIICFTPVVLMLFGSIIILLSSLNKNIPGFIFGFVLISGVIPTLLIVIHECKKITQKQIG